MLYALALEKSRRPANFPLFVIISHADIVRFYGQEISECTAGEAMSGRLLEIESGQPATLAAERMLEEGVQRLLVTECEGEERSLVGMISASDLVKDMRGAHWTWRLG